MVHHKDSPTKQNFEKISTKLNILNLIPIRFVEARNITKETDTASFGDAIETHGLKHDWIKVIQTF